MGIDSYDFMVRPPATTGDVAYTEEVTEEIERLGSMNESLAQMHARNFGRSAAVDMSAEMTSGGPEAVTDVVSPLAEAFNPDLRNFFSSGVKDVLSMTVENGRGQA